MSYTWHTLGVVLFLWRAVVCVFYSPSQQGFSPKCNQTKTRKHKNPFYYCINISTENSKYPTKMNAVREKFTSLNQPTNSHNIQGQTPKKSHSNKLKKTWHSPRSNVRCTQTHHWKENIQKFQTPHHLERETFQHQEQNHQIIEDLNIQQDDSSKREQCYSLWPNCY